MKNLLLLLMFLFSFSVMAQEEENSYSMFQNIMLTPKPGHGQELQAALKAHNDKYHKEGAESVNVWAVSSGPRTGTLLWSKGPLTWTHLDSPIEDENHMTDWSSNIMAHADMGPIEYWRLHNNRSYTPEGFIPKLFVVRYFDIQPNKGNNARELWNNQIEVYKKYNWDTSLQIYGNAANAGDGRDWAILWFHDSWASRDKERNFWDKYEEMHGMDRDEWFERWNEASKYMGMEILTLVPELSVIDDAQE